jgi:mRNA-degrading endonuclease RelE of RelBE toxin-antitoxin system
MSYKIIPTEKFKKEAKRLLKKYTSLKDDLVELNNELLNNPTLGISLGNNSYKIRLAIKSKAQGKSGGARVITYLLTENKEIYLLTIYDKADFDTIEDKNIKAIIKNIKQSN